MKRHGFILGSLITLLLACGMAVLSAAQTQREQPSSITKKTQHKSVQGTGRKRVAAKKRPTTASSLRARRLNRAFIASADLKPMARQLLDTRSVAAYAGVESYARRHPQSDIGALAWLAVGYARMTDHDYPKAIDALKLAQPRAGDLRDYVDYFLANSYAASGNSAGVLATLREFDSKYPESLVLRDAMFAYGVALLNSDRPAEAIRVLEAYRDPTRPDIELALGRAYAKNGDYANAASAFRRIYYGYPLSPESADAQKELDRLSAATVLPPPTYAERKARAELLAQAHRNADAAREYGDLLSDAPIADRIPIQVAVGVAMHASGNDGEARSMLEMLPETADESNSRRWLALAEIARSANDDAGFTDAISHLRSSGSTSLYFQQALLLGANMFLLRKDYDHAIDYYREVQERFPNGKYASYAHWKAAWLTLRQGRKQEAERQFEEQVSLYPDTPETPAALYWRARLAEEDGEFARAALWYQKLTYRYHQYYYAELARLRLSALPAGSTVHDPVLDGIPVPLRAVSAAVSGSVIPPADNVLYQKSLLLHNAGLTDFAVKELRAAAPAGTAWVNIQIAHYYQDDGFPSRALEALKRVVPSYYSLEVDALPRLYWETLFPRPYWTALKKYAQQNELDPFLVASLIRQESEFNPGAVSRSDALGLMQLLPTTGRKVARELRVRRFSTDQLLAPDFNMQLGTRYFRSLMDRFGGRLEYALAAYNAGADRVDTWAADGSFRGADEFVESIPFTETREYVQAIMRNAAIYKRLYGTP